VRRPSSMNPICSPLRAPQLLIVGGAVGILAQQKNPNVIVPVIHAFLGDSANPNLEAEIAAFREQCYLKARLEFMKRALVSVEGENA
uniref:hypothetical protein n=1 Tax=Acetomicrobium sp. S15 = DSM 107314 TaxID=2529858 RepID=UPI0018E12603